MTIKKYLKKFKGEPEIRGQDVDNLLKIIEVLSEANEFTINPCRCGMPNAGYVCVCSQQIDIQQKARQAQAKVKEFLEGEK